MSASELEKQFGIRKPRLKATLNINAAAETGYMPACATWLAAVRTLV
jgi:hypothetical protein